MSSNLEPVKAYAIRFSSLVSHLISFGLPSRKKHNTERVSVQAPRKSDIHRQAASPPDFSACEPKERSVNYISS